MRHQNTTTSRLAMLRGIEGMGELPARSLASIDRFSTETGVRAGRVLMRRGAPAREAYIVLDGTAAVWQRGQFAAVVSAGNIVGETALISGDVRGADVIAMTDMTLLVMSPAEFASLCDDPPFRVWLNWQIARRTTAAAGAPQPVETVVFPATPLTAAETVLPV